MIVFSQKLKPVEQKIVQKSIWLNGFYAHPEEDEWEDEDDIDSEELILCTAEKAAIQYLTVREFQFPKINFKATSYPNLINWKQVIQGFHMVSGSQRPAWLQFQSRGVRAGHGSGPKELMSCRTQDTGSRGQI